MSTITATDQLALIINGQLTEHQVKMFKQIYTKVYNSIYTSEVFHLTLSDLQEAMEAATGQPNKR